MQCGYCVPGMILSAAALIARQPNPGDADITAALDGNLCRCGAYPAIRRAVSLAAELARGPEAGFAPRPASATPPAITSSRGPWDLLPPTRRDYFSSLPDGLVAVLPPGRSGWWSSDGAWLHLGAWGRVIAAAEDVGRRGSAFTCFPGRLDLAKGKPRGVERGDLLFQ